MDCKPYVLKTVDLRFNGVDLSFELSHALFSSNDVDAGTRLLLKNIARYVPKDTVRSVLDIGSGTGVLGIACAKAYKAERVVMRDRDALATAFSERNALRNKVSGCVCETALFLDGLQGQGFDLVLSNVPAKAGTPVLDEVLGSLVRVVNPGGTCGIVVVNPIAVAAKASILASGALMVTEDSTKGHSVFLFRKDPGDTTTDVSGIFPVCIRTPVQQLTLGTRRYRFRGVFGLPEFDSLAFGTKLAADLLESQKLPVRASLLVVEPGAGHLPAYLSGGQRQLDLCSRDLLSLKASRYNLELNQGQRADTASESGQTGMDFAFPSDLPADRRYDLIVALPDIVPGLDQSEAFWSCFCDHLKPGALLVVALGSTFFERLERRRPRSFTRLREKKNRGNTAACWRYEGAIHEAS